MKCTKKEISVYTCAHCSVFLIGISSSTFIAEYIYPPLFEEVVIKSPGFPNANYTKSSTYKWHVNSFGITEKISIMIKMDIHRCSSGQCSDYLQVCLPKQYFLYFSSFLYFSTDILMR